ncbi:aldo/keto reductase [Arenibaculum pallidiluteum]|uniref:aldo/keto reductase n=1 Tax=Arenibaculum pallidiluteum TaxID=2812559 RepID=UPI001A957A5A|nr:aldo/keto reductase [Arenibaculum pallidiluteum]
MDRRRIGTTPVEVTEFGFGGAAIGGLYRPASRDAAMAALDAAWEAGLRCFDTAPFYGFGLSERRMGDFLRGKPRGSFVLSTKVGRLLRPVPEDQVPDHGYADPLPFAVDYDYGHDGVMRSVEFSLARLGLNRVDILLVHDIGAYTHGEEAHRRHFRDLMDGGLRALERLKAEGTIAAYGLGVNEVQVCLEVLARAPLDCILLAGRCTLLDRSAEAELIPFCEARGTSLLIGGALNSGILATGAVPGARFDYRPAPEAVMERVRGLDAAAARHGIPLAAAALRFPLRHRAVASVLLGAADKAELRRSLDLLHVPVPDAAWPDFHRHAIR